MARKTRFPRISAQEAYSALRWLHATGKVKSPQILTALKRRDRLVAEIRQQLEDLGGQGLRFLRGPEALERRPPRRKRLRKVSAAQQAAWRQQGRYLAAVRPLSRADRARVKAIREKSGVRAAIAAGKGMGK